MAKRLKKLIFIMGLAALLVACNEDEWDVGPSGSTDGTQGSVCSASYAAPDCRYSAGFRVIQDRAVVFYSVGELAWLFKGERVLSARDYRQLRIPSIFFYGGREASQAADAGRGDAYAKFAFGQSFCLRRQGYRASVWVRSATGRTSC